jgi:hypothetical protein
MNFKLTLLFFISLQFCFCQKTFDTNNNLETNIYIHSLEKYFESMQRDSTKKDCPIYIEKNYIHLDSFPKSIKDQKVNWMKKNDLESFLHKSEVDFIHLKIYPVMIEKDIFYVSIIPFYALTKYKKYKIEGGIFKFQYEFDIELKGLTYKNMIID